MGAGVSALVEEALRRQGKCALIYEKHPTQPHLMAICNRPLGHDGEHSNVMPKGGQPS